MTLGRRIVLTGVWVILAVVLGGCSMDESPDLVEVTADLATQVEDLTEHLVAQGAISEVEERRLAAGLSCTQRRRFNSTIRVFSVASDDLDPDRFRSLVGEVWGEDLTAAEEPGALFLRQDVGPGAVQLVVQFAHADDLAVRGITVLGETECLPVPDRFDGDLDQLDAAFREEVQLDERWDRW